jgi:putative transposase
LSRSYPILSHGRFQCPLGSNLSASLDSGHPGKPTRQLLAPNEGGSAAGTGPFKAGDGLYGDPLPGADGCRRLRLGCQARASPRVQEAQPVGTPLCQEWGLLQRLRTDTGVPWATTTLARLSQRSAWGLRLGRLPACIAPGKPQHNGRPERLPQTLPAETTPPPAATRRPQQHPCERFRQACNCERPHEALARQTPAARAAVSPRELPPPLPPVEDPDRCAGRYVSANGGLRWPPPWVNVAHVGRGSLCRPRRHR